MSDDLSLFLNHLDEFSSFGANSRSARVIRELREREIEWQRNSASAVEALGEINKKLEQQLAEAKRRIEYFEAKEARDLAKAEFEKQQSDCREFTNRQPAQGEEKS